MNESNIKGVSIRGIIVLVLIVVFSVSVFMGIKHDTLNNIIMAVIGWYFGQKPFETPAIQSEQPDKSLPSA